jgi:hypothetical protein
MWQEILITDLTRMSGQKVCFAGITHSGQVIRPILPHADVIEDDLFQNGVPVIRPRAVIKLNVEPKPWLKNPHTEDHVWLQMEQTQFLRVVDDQTWRTSLEATCSESVEAIFAAPLESKRMIRPGTGERSLGTVQIGRIIKFEYMPDEHDPQRYKSRMTFTDTAGTFLPCISISDLAFRTFADHLRIHKSLDAESVQKRLHQILRSRHVILRIGLTRPFQRDRKSDRMCFLQINGIYTFPDYLNGGNWADYRA